MKIAIEITETDIRSAVCDRLKQMPLPSELTDFFGGNGFQVRTTYRSNETWRRPKYLRMVIEKEIAL